MPDGSPKKLWAVKDDIIYALALDTRGRLLAGSGNRGRIVAIEKNGDFTDLVKASATQVTDFAPAPGGLYAVTSNLGKLFLLNSAPDSEGSFESEVLDAHIFSKWGRSETRGEGLYEVFVRSGNVDNPDRNWSPWKKVEFAKTAAVDAPPARFLQWKLVMRPEMRKDSNAMLDSVKFYYLPKNVAPVVEDVAVQTGARINPSSVLRPVNETIMINASGAQSTIPGSAQNPNPLMPHFETPLAAQKDRGSITVRWSAHDDNDDELSYSVYYKGDGETRWKLLKEKITDKFYSWDAGLLPDGGYMLRVVASDAPSHTPEEALTHFKDSQRFEVDNTPPRIDSLVAKSVDGKLNVTLTATDSFSSIQRAEYSLDAGPWQLVEPVGRISDSLNERYDFTVPLTKPAVPDVKMDKAELSIEHVIVVRVFDRFENMGTAKVVAK